MNGEASAYIRGDAMWRKRPIGDRYKDLVSTYVNLSGEVDHFSGAINKPSNYDELWTLIRSREAIERISMLAFTIQQDNLEAAIVQKHIRFYLLVIPVLLGFIAYRLQ